MDDRVKRQVSLLRRFVADYRLGEIGLNALLARIVGVGEALELDAWRERVFPIVLTLEQVNAATIHPRRKLNASQGALVDDALRQLEALLSDFDPGVGDPSVY